MKLYIYITDHESALKGDFAWSITTSSREDLGENTDWLLAGEVDVELSVDNEAISMSAINNLDKEIQETRAVSEAKITELERRKQELLAITYKP